MAEAVSSLLYDKLFEQIVQIVADPGQLAFDNLAVFNQDARPAVDDPPGGFALLGNKRECDLEKEQGENRDDAVKHRNIDILHRNGGEFGNHNRNDELIGL